MRADAALRIEEVGGIIEALLSDAGLAPTEKAERVDIAGFAALARALAAR
ncbi:hypothetical protein [Aliiruegeria haliotis]|nr:hypothetical protein [Aliiruegeria haliotis]